MPRSPKPRVVIGIDPSNDSAGIAAFVDGEYWWSFACSPWSAFLIPTLPLEWTCRVYAEAPRSSYLGKKASDSINAARGMIQARLLTHGLIKSTRDVRITYPDVWRKHIFGRGVQRDRDGWKRLALRKAHELTAKPIETDDEAEAILIAKYGWMKWRGA